MNESTTTICGNLTADPELRRLANGRTTVDCTVAVNRRWQDTATGNWQTDTSFLSVVCWGPLADHFGRHRDRYSRGMGFIE